MKNKILILHGPKLDQLGQLEPTLYGFVTLIEINNNLKKIGHNFNVELECFQSNFENELIRKTIESSNNEYAFLVVNPTILTYTSINWCEALLKTQIPFIEVHLSNIYARTEFAGKKSYFSDIAVGTISGLKSKGYELALLYAIEYGVVAANPRNFRQQVFQL